MLQGQYIAIIEVTQDGSNNNFHLLYTHCSLQLGLKQIDTCLNAHVHAYRLIAHTVADGAMALRIVICLGACTGISSSFQWLHSWPSHSPRGGRQLCGGAVQKVGCSACVCASGRVGARRMLI